MNSQITLYILSTIIILINLSFIFKANWWRSLQVFTLKKEEKWAKNIPLYKKIVDWEIKFAKGKYGVWLFRGLGLVWLFYTLFLLFSVLREF